MTTLAEEVLLHSQADGSIHRDDPLLVDLRIRAVALWEEALRLAPAMTEDGDDAEQVGATAFNTAVTAIMNASDQTNVVVLNALAGAVAQAIMVEPDIDLQGQLFMAFPEGVFVIMTQLHDRKANGYQPAGAGRA